MRSAASTWAGHRPARSENERLVEPEGRPKNDTLFRIGGAADDEPAAVADGSAAIRHPSGSKPSMM